VQGAVGDLGFGRWCENLTKAGEGEVYREARAGGGGLRKWGGSTVDRGAWR
jgi:hypothetical protein